MLKSNFVLIFIATIIVCGSLNAEIIEIGAIDTPGDANDVAVAGSLAYVADNQAGLRIIDISNPEEPVEVGSLDTPGTALSVAISGDYAYIADGPGGLCIVDISDPENPNAIGAFQGQLIINDVVVNGDYVYLADLIGGLRVIDISDPENPQQVGICDTPDLPQGLFLSDQYMYIADRRSGLQIVNISDPEQPEIIGSLDTPGEANAVFVQDDYAYVADKANGLRIIDISDPANPAESGSFDTEGLAYDVTVSTHYAYIADGANGFLAFNVSDPENPVLVGGLDTPGTSYGIDFAGGYAFVADGGSGLKVLQLTPEIVLSDEVLDFGRVDIGERAELALTIANEGHADLVISDIVVEGLYFGCDFEGEVILEIDSAYELIITLRPQWFGDFVGTVIITSNDFNSPERSSAFGFSNLVINQKITADDAGAGDRFGYSVSISGDYAIIGAYCNDDNGGNSGSAYIFVRDGDNWTQQAKLTANDAAAGNRFGISVSISGDYAVIGAYYNDDASGSAYIFVRDGEEWTQQAKLTADDAVEGDLFGYSVSIDGVNVAVGAHHSSDNGGWSGSAYIFVRDGEEWTQQAKLTADDAAAEDRFGISVSICGDYAIIGAYRDNNNSGSAYIFVRDGEEWTQQAKLTANDADEGDHFGNRVSISGDYVIVGASGNNDDGENSGSAYIFFRDGNRWIQQVKLTAEDANRWDCFGWTVSISGNCAVIGAEGNDDGGADTGSAYIFVLENNRWVQQVKLTAGDAGAGDLFGYSVSISGDHVISGAYGNDDDGEESGSAYMFTVDLPDRPKIRINPNPLNFGGVVAGSSSEMNLTIGNIGEVDLQISDITVNGECFEVDFDRGFVIEPGGNEEVSVLFFPENDQDYNATLTIRTNDPLNQELPVELLGTGLFASRVSLNAGWNLISINTYPPQELYGDGEDRGPDIIRMMGQLRINVDNHHVQLMKNEDGRFYVPAMEFNNIPFWDLSEGYHVLVDADVEAVWAGNGIPADTDIHLERGWNLIAYYPTYQLDATAPSFYALSPIIDHVLLAKDNRANFMAPTFNFSNMRPWRETQGYGVKVDADVVLNYPEEQDEVAFNTALADAPVCQIGHWNIDPTGENMSVLITSLKVGQASLPASGSQIAAFSLDGVLIGSGFVDADGRCGLAVWGDDKSTDEVDGLQAGEAFTLKLWNGGTETELSVEAIQEGAGLVYATDSFTVLELSAETVIPKDFYLSQAFPNPFNSMTRITYGLPVDSRILVRSFDISGRLVAMITDGNCKAGIHEITWDATAISSGIYFVRMDAGAFSSTRKIMLLK